jgi:hypothetical protein
VNSFWSDSKRVNEIRQKIQFHIVIVATLIFFTVLEKGKYSEVNSPATKK